MEHTNFYENMQEANRRLRSTVVSYDGTPMFVLGIANHRPDGVFRVYLLPLGTEHDIPHHNLGSNETGAPGDWLDQWMVENPDKGCIRKMINSPKFRKFRPFPLGMINWRTNNGAQAFYCMRQPTRNKEQGLTDRMVLSLPIKVQLDEVVSHSGSGKRSPRGVKMVGSPTIDNEAFAACVLADHPTVHEVIANLNDPECINHSAAFDRHFAIARGPIGSLFLVYKANVVGLLPHNDVQSLIVDSKFTHTLEAIAELEVFENISVKSC